MIASADLPAMGTSLPAKRNQTQLAGRRFGCSPG